MTQESMKRLFRLAVWAVPTFAAVAVAGLGAYVAAAQQNQTRTNPLLTPGVQKAVAATGLAPVESFASIQSQKDRSVALYLEAAKVIEHPRCMNCHPVTRRPSQGDDMHSHIPPIKSDAALFAAGIQCTSCHGPVNRPTNTAGIRSIPGADPWQLAPLSMGWQTLTTGQICERLKDRAHNGDRSLEQIRVHLSEDHLVGWAWHPGEGRKPVPGTQEKFGHLITAWIETGAYCPE
ncbi:hypothetical protein [Ferrovibrio xuzhouensis]|uniref:Isoquinoline 1-oxidoreductase subunit n=1 Tax=Ferrovibrio xuzhouensis TaxID=1576914 RepID=A0ABV7VNW3_9PROT